MIWPLMALVPVKSSSRLTLRPGAPLMVLSFQAPGGENWPDKE
jgi:hypothetical protein